MNSGTSHTTHNVFRLHDDVADGKWKNDHNLVKIHYITVYASIKCRVNPVNTNWMMITSSDPKMNA